MSVKNKKKKIIQANKAEYKLNTTITLAEYNLAQERAIMGYFERSLG